MQSDFLVRKLEEFWDHPRRRELVQIVVAAGVLGLSALIARLGSVSMFQRMLILVVGAGGLTVLLRWPNLGLLATLAGAYFVGFTGPGGINLVVLGIAGLSALWIADSVIRQRSFRFNDRRTTIPVLLFMLSALLSFGIGQLPWYPLARHAPITAQVGGLLIFLLSAMAFLLVANTVREVRWLQAVCYTFIAIGSIYILGRLVPEVANVMRRYFQPGMTTGSLFWLWLTVIPFSQALLNKQLRPFWRAAMAMLVVATLYVAIGRASEWKSGYLPPLAGMATIVALLLGRRVVYFAPVMLVLAWLVGSEALASDQYSYISRVDAWKIVIQLSMINPIFGIGFSNYYWYTHLIPIMGWHVAFNSHSQYVDIFSQTGLLGMAAFAWIFWETGKLGIALRRRAPEGFAKAYVYGALGGLVGTLVAGGLVDWVLPFAYNIGMNGFRASVLSWIFLGGLVALRHIIEPSPASEDRSVNAR